MIIQLKKILILIHYTFIFRIIRLHKQKISVLNTEKIAEAVRNGAMEGSLIGSSNGAEKGIIGLSENRQVQQNASF